MWTNMNICTSCLNHWGVTFDIYFWTGLHQWDFFYRKWNCFIFCLFKPCCLYYWDGNIAFVHLIVVTTGDLLLIFINCWMSGFFYDLELFFLIFLCLIHSSLTRHLICSLANHHTNCCDDCSLSALTSSWSLLKGKGTMGQVAVVGDVAAEQEGLAIEMESATCQPLPLKILDNSLPWVANEISPEPLSIQFWVPLIMHRKWLE
jgi:hypothetical protein